MGKYRRGEVATILTLGALAVLTISALTSSIFNNKKTTTTTKAVVRRLQKTATTAICADPKWYCLGECAPQSARDAFGGNPENWRIEKQANCAKNNDSSCVGPCDGKSVGR